MAIPGEQRIISLDLLRGLAVLGILLLNIGSLGLPMSAYLNPTAYGDFDGINEATWLFTHVLAENKFVTLFAVLFGAGIVLFSERATSRSMNCKKLHYRRMGWLLIFGLAHGWLLWYGDILFIYAVAGMLVFVMRNLRTTVLVSWALIFYLIPFVMGILAGASTEHWQVEDIQSIMAIWQPDAGQLAAELDAMRGSYAEQLGWRAELTLMMQTQTLLFDFLWRTSALMLLGMVLYRWGIITARRSQRFYRYLALLLVPGITLTIIGVVQKYSHGFSWQESMFFDSQWNYFGGVLTMLGYVGLAILWLRSPWFPALRRRVRAVGQMAFSCYIMHTIIGVLLFNVLGLFGALERFELLLIVVAVWVFQLYWAPWHLQYFGQGPLERLWRKLTYRGLESNG